jgi:hypothetical protein
LLFSAVAEIKNNDVAMAIWNSHKSDLGQREMLNAATAKRFAPKSFEFQEIEWLLCKIKPHSGKRNAAIHGPLDVYSIISGNDKTIAVFPDLISKSELAYDLSEKPHLLWEFHRCRVFTELLSEHARSLWGHVSFRGWETGAPFPDRPVELSREPPQSFLGNQGKNTEI